MRRRTFVRATLVGLTLAAAGGVWWLRTTERHRVRFLRQMLAESSRAVAAPELRPRPHAWSDDRITLAWVGHATVLINFYGVRILTDPVLGERVGVALGGVTVGPKRYIAPALSLMDLPSIDLLLLSHAHMDHLDLPTLRQFPASAAVVTARDTADLFAPTGLRQLTELRWGDRVRLQPRGREITIEAFEVKHWGARWPSRQPRGYNGYILRREDRALIFGGDTAQTPAFGGLRAGGRYAVAIMPIGAYNPWIANHCTPEQAVEMVNRAGANYLLPMHHQTFRLSDEPMDEPLARLEAALVGEPERLAVRSVGETFVVPG